MKTNLKYVILVLLLITTTFITACKTKDSGSQNTSTASSMGETSNNPDENLSPALVVGSFIDALSVKDTDQLNSLISDNMSYPFDETGEQFELLCPPAISVVEESSAYLNKNKTLTFLSAEEVATIVANYTVRWQDGSKQNFEQCYLLSEKNASKSWKIVYVFTEKKPYLHAGIGDYNPIECVKRYLTAISENDFSTRTALQAKILEESIQFYEYTYMQSLEINSIEDAGNKKILQFLDSEVAKANQWTAENLTQIVVDFSVQNEEGHHFGAGTDDKIQWGCVLVREEYSAPWTIYSVGGGYF